MDWNPKLRWPLVAAMIVLATAGPAFATTWYVEADGSGDFPTIQAAVDACVPGDVVELGPGVHDDYVTYPHSPFWSRYVDVAVDGLTLRGAGIDQTIVGQVESGVHDDPAVVVTVYEDDIELRIEDLTLQLLDRPSTTLVASSRSGLIIERCRLAGADRGVSAHISRGLEIRDCEFVDLADGLVNDGDHAGSIANTSFERIELGIYASNHQDLTLTGCRFDGSESGGNSVGVYTESQGRAELRDCEFVNHTRAAMLVSGANVQLYDCRLLENAGNGIEVSGGLVEGTGNVITSDVMVIGCSGYGSAEFVAFRDNHLLAGGTGKAFVAYSDTGTPRTLDLENNWWGTDDPARIADLIHDSLDDPELVLTVDFDPFLGGVVASKSRSWSSIKELFR
jgi:hypothetical protein